MKIKYMFLFLVLGSWLLAPVPAFARPERIAVKSEPHRQRESRARTTARTIDLTQVQDLEARRALRTLFDQLGLETRS